MRFRCLPCEAAPEPPVTRPGHMAEPQTSRSHSWQPPKNVLPATSSKNAKPSNRKVQIQLLNNVLNGMRLSVIHKHTSITSERLIASSEVKVGTSTRVWVF